MSSFDNKLVHKGWFKKTICHLIIGDNLASRCNGLPRKFPGDFPRSSPTVALNSNPAIQRFLGSFQAFPGRSSDFTGSFPDFPGGQPLSLRSLTPSPDSQKLSLIYTPVRNYCENNSENIISCNRNEIFQDNNSHIFFACNPLNHKRTRVRYFAGMNSRNMFLGGPSKGVHADLVTSEIFQ